MGLLVFWNTPFEHDDVDQIRVLKGSASDGSDFSQVAVLNARDGYDDWITHFHDLSASSTDTRYYRALFFEEGSQVAQSPIVQGEVSYQVTPQDVLNIIQGIPKNYVAASLIQAYIKHRIAEAETIIRQKLSPQQVTHEKYGARELKKILDGQGRPFQLRHFPVRSVEGIFYRTRGTNLPVKELANADIEIEHVDNATGFNHGLISVQLLYASLESFYMTIPYKGRLDNRLQLYVSYTHGYDIWPNDLVEAIKQLTAASILEIAGEAETAGLTSKSIDGVAESYGASATTTQASARRIYYEEAGYKILERHRRPIFG